MLARHFESLTQHEWDDDDEAPGLTRKLMEEAGDKLSDFLWTHRYALMHGARERAERADLAPLRYDYRMRDAEWR